MSKNNYYAVAKGRKPGIYQTWYGPDGADEQVKGYSGAVFKGFPTLQEAEAWLKEVTTSSTPKKIFQRNVKESGDALHTGTTPQRSTQGEGDKVVIYTDGGCIGNPGPGGYGVVVKQKGQRKELSGGYRLTTNNRMELTACIVALQSLEAPSSVILYSDSQYVVNGITLGWAKSWRSNGWRRSNKEKAENPDLWEKLLDLCDKHRVEFQWVRGHAGNRENERCDQLSMEAAQGRHLLIDTIYENNKA